MRILLDVDDVVASLSDCWIEMYNCDHQDTVKKEDITDWDIGTFTKIGKDFYNYLHVDNIYYGVEPVENALDSVLKLKAKRHRVIYVTAYDYGNHKIAWLKNNGFLDNDNDYIVARDKSLVNGDIIVDDSYDNIKKYSNENHKPSILFTQPWNKKFEWHERAMDWDEVLWWINMFEVKN